MTDPQDLTCPARCRVVFAGCVRDGARHLPAVLANVERAAASFAEVAFIFVENDSSDDTVQILDGFARQHPHVHIDRAPSLVATYPRRTERLAAARSRYLEHIATSALRSYDYLIVLDPDDINAQPWDPRAIERAIAFLGSDRDHAGAFSNQPSLYYDMWALRHPKLCPTDIWEEVLDYAITHTAGDEVAFAATFEKRYFRIAEDRGPLEVDSAFGGLGIYRLPWVLGNRYVGSRRHHMPYRGQLLRFDCEVCEHVALHAAIRGRAGRLFVLPWLVNSRTPPSRFDPSFYRMIFRQLMGPE